MIAPDAAAAIGALPEGAPEGETALLGLRRATERWARQSRLRTPVGLAPLDEVLAGGWPQGRVSELVGAPSSGRTALAMVSVAAATARGELTAWVDAGDAFDPAAALAAGVALDKVLWVRPVGWEQAVRAAELVLEVRGFTVVVADLASTRGARTGLRREARSADHGGALRLRLARATERAGAVVLVLAERPWTGALAGVVVELGRSAAMWGGDGGSPRWLAGLRMSARVARGAGGAVPLELGIGHGSRITEQKSRTPDPGARLQGWRGNGPRVTDHGPLLPGGRGTGPREQGAGGQGTGDRRGLAALEGGWGPGPRTPDPGPRTPSLGWEGDRTPDPGSRPSGEP
jgi:hypothetical protein